MAGGGGGRHPTRLAVLTGDVRSGRGASGEQAVLLLGSAMSGLSLVAAGRAAAGPTEQYPFGRESLVPLAELLGPVREAAELVGAEHGLAGRLAALQFGVWLNVKLVYEHR